MADTINRPEVYIERGRKCALARNHRDKARAKFESDWLSRALALEPREERARLRELFDGEYRRTRKHGR